MPRTTSLAVGGIVELDSNISTAPAIETASALVDDHCSSLADTRQELVERYLAAHFYSLRVRQVASEKAGPVSQNFEAPVLGKGLEQTTFGQQAMGLDSSGNLSAWNKAVVDGRAGKVQFDHLGTCD
jgi:hypothetical protein